MKLKFRAVIARGLRRALGMLCQESHVLRLIVSVADKWGLKKRDGGRIKAPFVLKRGECSFQVLVYHRVNEGQDPIFGGVPLKVFKNQMECLSEYFNVFPLEELVRGAKYKDIPPRAVAITFDDGYLDNYENAFPILKSLNLPATIFLATGAIDTNGFLWHDSLFDAFRRTRVKVTSIEGRDYPLRTAAERRAGVDAFRRYLRNCDHDQLDSLLATLRSALRVRTPCVNRRRYLNWREVQEMSQSQITFGAHTVTHPLLTRISLQEAGKEIVNSRDMIEKRLGSYTRLFAYPNGHREDFNERIKRVLKEAGFVCAVTILPGNNDVYTDPYELRRIPMWDSDPTMYALRLAGYKFFA